MYCTEILLDFLSSASQLRNLRVNSQTFSRLRILLAYSHEISKTRHSKTTPTVSLLWNSRRWRHCPCPWTKNVHGCTDKKLIERQTTKMSTEERRHGDTETRRHVHINDTSSGARAMRGFGAMCLLQRSRCVSLAPECAAVRCPCMSALKVPVVRVPSCACGPPCVFVYCTSAHVQQICTYYSTVGT